MKKTIFFLLIVLIVISALVSYDVYEKVFTPYKGYDGTTKINIKDGSTVTDIGKKLFNERIISSFSLFRVYYRFFFNHAHLKSGEYKFNKAMTMKQVIEKLIEGKVILYKITIKEGMIIKEMAEFLEKKHQINYQEFMKAALNTEQIKDIDQKATDLEGYLYPDTYFIRKEMGATEFVKLMVSKFKSNFSNPMKWKARNLKLSIRKILVLASLIEKETSSREERFLISSVFHNRLRIGMPMGCDPTIIYALKRDNIYQGKLGWKELKYDSPYNTRLHRGLPPGPICSPGFASIEAALNPENTKYLYFVAKSSRTHYFSKSLKEHNRAVKKYIINRSK
jgi:UPF0755 protein